MPVPILLVTGFLGAGKTTIVNHLLAHAAGRRIAAVVNDFGAINIDAELIAGASDGVVSLSNGCICCSLEGDLLRTLATLLSRTSPRWSKEHGASRCRWFGFNMPPSIWPAAATAGNWWPNWRAASPSR